MSSDVEESTFRSHDGTEIHFYHWPASAPEPTVMEGADTLASPCRAHLLILHGLGEHGGRYAKLAHILNNAGMDVVAMDHRGHGKSGGPRGHIVSVETVMKDVDHLRLLRYPRNDASCKHFFLMGHSMGGQLALHYALWQKNCPVDAAPLAGLVCSSPWLRLSFEPPAAKVFFGKLIGRLIPKISLSNELDPTTISRVPEEVQAYVDDKLNHEKITGGTFVACNNGANKLMNGGPTSDAVQFPVPLLMLHGTADKICSPVASREFFDRIDSNVCPDKTYESFEQGYHELHKDLCASEFETEVRDWLLHRSG